MQPENMCYKPLWAKCYAFNSNGAKAFKKGEKKESERQPESKEELSGSRYNKPDESHHKRVQERLIANGSHTKYWPLEATLFLRFSYIFCLYFDKET